MKTQNKSIPAKKNLSSMHVLKTLEVLMKGNYTMPELVQKLNEDESVPVFNNSVVSKYINTCRFCGIDIPKIYNRYFVISIPFGLKISETENELIIYLQECALKSLSTVANQKFVSFISKLSNYSNRKLTRVEKSEMDATGSIFNDAIMYQHKVLLMLKNKTMLEGVPIGIVEHDGNKYFHIYHNNKEKMILIGRVVGLEILKDRFVSAKKATNIMFKLTGNLAKNYNLRENETIVENALPQNVTISNHNDNKLLLISRLLRYGELCEIQSPISLRKEMLDIINDTLANYGEV